jgi:hypothetical protein
MITKMIMKIVSSFVDPVVGEGGVGGVGGTGVGITAEV